MAKKKRKPGKRARGLEKQIAKTEKMRKQSLPRPKWLYDAYEARLEEEEKWDSQVSASKRGYKLK
jgi:hypothetical protein